MLKSVDILIGLSGVMLVVSMAVTLVTQALLTAWASRGRHLLSGLADLLEQLHPGTTREHAEAIAQMVLNNTVISSGRRRPWIWRYGEVVHREELTKILLDLAAADPKAAKDAVCQTALVNLREAVIAAGIKNPAETLDNVRMMALQLEKSNPELSSSARHNLALLQEASSQYLAKINLWFDQTMDRVSERFTFSARIWTFASAALIAIALQLDTVTLVNKLAVNDQMRAAFVDAAMEASGELEPGAPADAQIQRRYMGFLAAQGVILPPTNWDQWWASWQRVNLPGLFISILLLSLGAPFWYGTLNRLLQLRSVLAQKDDEQRKDRQTTRQPAPETGVALVPALAVGERGDLNAIG